eukprot:COSAG01_NODE_179_length_22923_cov_25.190535_6_plen_147_part_00
MTSVKLHGVAKSSDNQQVHYVASDPKASYTLLNPNVPEDYSPACIDWVSPDKVDYNLMPPTAVRVYHTNNVESDLAASRRDGYTMSTRSVALCSISAEWSLHAQVQDPAGPRMCDRRVSSRAFHRSMGRWGVCGCMPLLFAREVSR